MYYYTFNTSTDTKRFNLFTKYYYGDEMKSGACSTQGKDEECTQGFRWKI
jgi:hypothetical protein